MSRAICMANSRREGGRCLGFLVEQANQSWQWVRPVSARSTDELYSAEYLTADGHDPRPLDVLGVTLGEPVPSDRQPENFALSSERWTLEGDADAELIQTAVLPLEQLGPDLFGDTNASILTAVLDANPPGYSLAFTRPNYAEWYLTSGFKGGKRVRVRFELGGREYDLPVTDHFVEQMVGGKELGPLELEEVGIRDATALGLVVSLGEEFPAMHACYKLVAGVMELPS